MIHVKRRGNERVDASTKQVEWWHVLRRPAKEREREMNGDRMMKELERHYTNALQIGWEARQCDRWCTFGCMLRCCAVTQTTASVCWCLSICPEIQQMLVVEVVVVVREIERERANECFAQLPSSCRIRLLLKRFGLTLRCCCYRRRRRRRRAGMLQCFPHSRAFISRPPPFYFPSVPH